MKAFLALMTLLPSQIQAATDNEWVVYVAPNGNDAWSGQLSAPNADGTDGPLATLERAQDAVRARRRQKTVPQSLTVQLRGGVYELSRPFIFTPEDSGTAAHPTTWEAFPGEQPVISGGRRIAGWREDADGRWTVELPGVKAGDWYFHQLFVEGRRRPRARTPNQGWLRARRTLPKGLLYEPGDIRRWQNLDDAMLFIHHLWVVSFHYVERLDEERGFVKVSTPDIPWNGFPPPWEAHQRYVVENVIEALDEPGEWYLNRHTGRLTYLPMPGERLERFEATAPVLTATLVDVQGDPGKGRYVEHLVFRGISFQHTDPHLQREGKGCPQAAVLQNAAIRARGLRHSRFEDCEIAHVGEHGLWLGAGSQDNQILRCHVHDLGAGAIRIGESELPSNDAQKCDRNTIDNCFAHDGGHIFRGAAGVWLSHASHTRVTHNEIRDFLHTGISVGWQWGYAPSSAHHNLIEHNHVHHIGHGVLSDMGAIYTLGVSPGTAIRYNVIHDVRPYPKLYNAHLTAGLGVEPLEGSGIYLDEGSSGIVVESNLVYNIDGAAWFINYGRDNIVRNNILANSLHGVWVNHPDREHTMFTLERNVIAGSTRHVVAGKWQGKATLGHNLYWATAGGAPLFVNGSFEQWRRTGRDQDSLVVDPKFVNGTRADFRLQRGSPAEQIGFEPFDLDAAGLYGDSTWVALPDRLPLRPDAPRPGPRPSETIDDDFEYPGILDRAPLRARSFRRGDTRIEVTDECAASGRQCVKFVDAANAGAPYEPHLYYEPNFFDAARLRFSFDVLNTRDAPAAIEISARDWRKDPFKTGFMLTFGADGMLSAGGRSLCPTPLGRWLHVEVCFATGSRRAGTWTLQVAAKDGQGHVGLPCTGELPYADPEFKCLTWLGVSSVSEGDAVFYLDNLKLHHAATGR